MMKKTAISILKISSIAGIISNLFLIIIFVYMIGVFSGHQEGFLSTKNLIVIFLAFGLFFIFNIITGIINLYSVKTIEKDTKR